MPIIPLLPWLRTHIIFPKLFGSSHLLCSVKAFAISSRFICHPQVSYCHGNYCNNQNAVTPDWFIHPPRTPNVSLVFYGFEFLILARRKTYCRGSHTYLRLHGFTVFKSATFVLLCFLHPLPAWIYPECSCEMWRSVVGNHIRKSSVRDYELH